MHASLPHYLLQAETYRSGRGLPRWRFNLQAVGSDERLTAADNESTIRRSRLELLAVVRGLEALDSPSRVTLLTRSRYHLGFRKSCGSFRFGSDKRAYGTTGYLADTDATGPGLDSWSSLFDPPGNHRVGMLAELRELVGAALIACGHDPNETGDTALGQARSLLEAQAPRVTRYDSADFVSPVTRGELAAHHAWNGPAAKAARAGARFRYVVPVEGAILWVTTAAVPVGAPEPDRSMALLAELMDPALAIQSTIHFGFATPNQEARGLLPAELRDDPALFPDRTTLARCHALHDLGEEEGRLAMALPSRAAPGA